VHVIKTDTSQWRCMFHCASCGRHQAGCHIDTGLAVVVWVECIDIELQIKRYRIESNRIEVFIGGEVEVLTVHTISKHDQSTPRGKHRGKLYSMYMLYVMSYVCRLFHIFIKTLWHGRQTTQHELPFIYLNNILQEMFNNITAGDALPTRVVNLLGRVRCPLSGCSLWRLVHSHSSHSSSQRTP